MSSVKIEQPPFGIRNGLVKCGPRRSCLRGHQVDGVRAVQLLVSCISARSATINVQLGSNIIHLKNSCVRALESRKRENNEKTRARSN